MKKLSLFFILLTAFVIVPQKVFAHCPLCTAGAGVIAAVALAIGVKIEVVGILVGAFAAALGFYLANRVKRQRFRGQKWVIVVAVFLVTIVPMLPFMYAEPYPLVIYWFGELGSLFNSVYLIDRFIVGSITGAIAMALSPKLSEALTKWRSDKRYPYQSLTVTLSLLIVLALIIQFLV